jgi:sorbitol-specific phosphotransferase system component IIBC
MKTHLVLKDPAPAIRSKVHGVIAAVVFTLALGTAVASGERIARKIALPASPAVCSSAANVFVPIPSQPNARGFYRDVYR